ncbi:hypothetical protein [Tahibacter caeni]|uniref:hypothetical protein n=1 Tax=Tahibacter caeni TaxID=1453545 RepID=UPI0021476383|nr:hypothetical protein [Tahibacter caeni]
MWRVILVVLVLTFAAYRIIGGGAGKPGDAPVADAVNYDGYMEVRMLMQGDQREIELVAVEERPPAGDCEKGATGTKLLGLCPAGSKLSCRIKNLECSRDVEPRYHRMLDGQAASVHYAHVQVDSGPGAPRRAVLLGWGMTEQESQMLCGAVQASANKNNKLGGKVTCI